MDGMGAFPLHHDSSLSKILAPGTGPCSRCLAWRQHSQELRSRPTILVRKRLFGGRCREGQPHRRSSDEKQRAERQMTNRTRRNRSRSLIVVDCSCSWSVLASWHFVKVLVEIRGTSKTYLYSVQQGYCL